MKPICVSCQRFYRIVKTGVYFVESMPKSDRVLPGTREPHRWKPYKLWSGDKWACPDCGAETIVGVGAAPVSEHYKPDFERLSEKSELTVNDC